MSRAILLYLHVHQPFRVQHYTIFDIGNNHSYFEGNANSSVNNREIIQKVAEKSYLPTNKYLLQLLARHPEFRLSLSITGTVLEQLEKWHPTALDSFRQLVSTGKVEIVAETYHHSLAFFYSRHEFEEQVRLHEQKIHAVFGQKPTAFRNTELSYNNDLATWAEQAGYKAILTEGWDKILEWRSPNFVYQPTGTENIRLLMKNYRLSDDIAFRFGDRNWSEWPLTAEKFTHWLNSTQDATNFNLFMDYETFGEHQWGDTGIFEFLEHLPEYWLQRASNRFMTVSEAADAFQPVGEIDVPETITWADTERDLSAWLGNNLQTTAIKALYSLERKIKNTHDLELIDDWRKLQTSDHFYYMCTKWANDGDIHAYFSPYENPYDAYIAFMNAFHDLEYRLSRKGLEV